MIKEIILAKIKAKFPGINLSKARLNAIAAKIEAIVIDDETKVDATLDTLNSLYPLADIAKDDDKARGLEAKLNAGKKPKPETDSSKKDDETTEENSDAGTGAAAPDKMPEWAKPLFKTLETVNQKVAAFEKKEQQQTFTQKIASQLKGVPEKFWNKRVLPTTDEEIEAFVEDVTTDYKEIAGEQAEQGFAQMRPPAASGAEPTKATSKAAVTKATKDISTFLDRTLPAESKTAKTA